MRDGREFDGQPKEEFLKRSLMNIEAVTSGLHIHPLKQCFKQNKGSGTEFSKNHVSLFFKTRRKGIVYFSILHTPQYKQGLKN